MTYTHDDAGTVLARWEPIEGYEAVVIVGPMGALCGYVRVPDSHPWHDKGYSWSFCGHSGCYEHTPESEIDVHGGLTFDGRPMGIEDGYWFGFDCSHAGDLVPALNDHGFSLDRDDVYRDEAYVRSECEKLARQIAVHETPKA